MKALVALSILQSACIIFLIYEVAGRDAAVSVAAPSAGPSQPVRAAALPGPGTGLDEPRLRQIIREELASSLPDMTPAGQDPHPATGVAAPRDPELDRQRKAQVDQQLAIYRSVGKISETQMLDLQRDIAQLEPADRREMMAKLIRALNAGEIDALM